MEFTSTGKCRWQADPILFVGFNTEATSLGEGAECWKGRSSNLIVCRLPYGEAQVDAPPSIHCSRHAQAGESVGSPLLRGLFRTACQGSLAVLLW